jgi:AraC-like DNA-binding protein/mannose-6-phosphate isomerase-like protein (cupin superfamily)
MAGGKTVARRRTPAPVEVPEGAVRVLESHHARDFQMEMGEWPFHKICWVVVGHGRCEAAEEAAVLEPGDFLLIPARTPHRFVDDAAEPLTLIILCVHPEAVEPLRDPALGPSLWDYLIRQLPVMCPLVARTRFHYNSLVDNFRRALREQERAEVGWEICLKEVAHTLLLRFARQALNARNGMKRSLEDEIEGALDYMETQFHKPLRLDDMAQRCGMSPRRFTDLFKARTGLTFSQWLIRRRVDYACERLRESGHILYACHESGFNDPGYFYRVFKSVTGRTPGEFLRAQ